MLHPDSLPRLRQWFQQLGKRYAKTAAHYASTLTQRRPIWMGTLALDEASLSEGLRAACASSLMLLLGNWLHTPDFAYAAIGAFWTCLADAAGSNRLRLASMGAFSVLSTLCGGLTAYAAGHGLPAALGAVLLFSSLGALGRIWGPAAAQVAILAATACVVMVGRPVHSAPGDYLFLALYFLGCVFATTLSLTLWRIHPFGPSRDALRTSYARLAEIAQDIARLLKHEQADFGAWALHAAKYRGQTRAAIEAARNALAQVPAVKADGRQLYGALLIILADSEQIFTYLIALSDSCERHYGELPKPLRAARALDALAEVLRRVGRAVDDDPHTPVPHLHEALRRLAQRVAHALDQALVFNLTAPSVEAALNPIIVSGWAASTGTSLAAAWQTLRANCSWQSIGMRHAARVGAATTAAFVLVHTLGLPFGYWATMATLLILQPSIANSWPRSIERAVGSIAGALLAAVIGLLVHSPIAISLVVFPLVCATMALRSVNYSLFVFFITPAFVLVADFAATGGNEFSYALARLGNNVLGCLVALLATFFLWPNRELSQFGDSMARAAAANLRFLQAALARAESDHLDPQRLQRMAGLASNNAEEVLARIHLEHLDSNAIDRSGATALALLRRIAGLAARIRLAEALPQIDRRLLEWIDAVSAELQSFLRDGTASAQSPVTPPTEMTGLAADAVDQVVLLRRIVLEH